GVRPKGILHEARRVDAGAAGPERAIDAIFYDAVNQYRVDVLAPHDEVSGHRNRVTVESRDSAYSRNGKISDHLQISKRPAYGFHRFGGDAAATNAAELLRVAEWLQVRSGAEID